MGLWTFDDGEHGGYNGVGLVEITSIFTIRTIFFFGTESVNRVFKSVK